MPALACLLLFLTAPTVSEDGRPSLDEFRRQLIERRDRARAELQPLVDEKLNRLRTILASASEMKKSTALKSKLESLQNELNSLPLEAAPLLVPHIDVEFNNTEDGAPVAKMVHDALLHMGARGITRELAAMARSEHTLASRYAIDLLAQSNAPLDAGAALVELWRDPPSTVGFQIADAILQLGDPQGITEVIDVLTTDSLVKTAWVLEALIAHPSPVAGQAVSNYLASQSQTLTNNLDFVLVFYERQPEAFQAGQARILIGMISSETGLSTVDQKILDTLPRLKQHANPSWTAFIRSKLSNGLRPKFDHALRICLALCGDMRIRKQLLAKSDDELRDLKKNFKSDIREAVIRKERGQLYLALKEFDHAANEFGKAFKLYPDAWKEQLGCGIDQARAYALGNRLRKAYSRLKALDLSATQRTQCAADPDFATLLASPQYGEVLKPR